MAKVKNKKKLPKKQSLKQFFHVRSNIILVALTILIVGLTMKSAIGDLSIKSNIIYCRPNDIRDLGLNQTNIDSVHRGANELLLICGVALSTLAGWIIYRNKKLKWILVAFIVALTMYLGLLQIAEAFNKAFSCLDF